MLRKETKERLYGRLANAISKLDEAGLQTLVDKFVRIGIGPTDPLIFEYATMNMSTPFYNFYLLDAHAWLLGFNLAEGDFCQICVIMRAPLDTRIELQSSA